MLIDTHCHISTMIKADHKMVSHESELPQATKIINEAQDAEISFIVNIGANAIDNRDCILLSKNYNSLFITLGISPEPGDCSYDWKKDIEEIRQWMLYKNELKIVGIGECGLDKHYPEYDLNCQRDLFKAQIELALEHELALVVHSRDAYDETLGVLEEYKNDITRAVMHCFSYDNSFAQTIIEWNFMIGIGGTVTYPRNNELRTAVYNTDLCHIVLETDAPFLTPQAVRGTRNHPKNIKLIAEFVAELKRDSYEHVAQQTFNNSIALFNLDQYIMHLN